MRMIDMKDKLLNAFSTAAKQRKKRADWILFEREAMTDAVNLERSRLGKSPVSIHDVEMKEQNAVGHSDYTEKFALGCAELVCK
jgi:hypothetical protein